MMLKVGITGGIGSGKTTVCKVFELLGVPVFYADVVAKQIMVEDDVLIANIKQTFGPESYFADGTLNNKHIAGIVFNNEAELAKLNAIVHPAVFRAYDKWIITIPNDTPYVLKEAALLFESGSYTVNDKNILVTAPIDIRLERVMKRDNVTAEQVLSRIHKQFTDEEKLKLADFVVENDDFKPIIPQVLALHEKFIDTKIFQHSIFQ